MTGKLLLITPPYHAGIVEAAGNWPHLGFIYIAGHTRAAGFEVEIYDAMTKKHSLVEIKRHIAECKPDFVGSTAYTASINDAMAVLQAAKEVNPDIKTIIGGIHASFCYRELLTQYKGKLDFVVIGEGEMTTPELLSALRSGTGLGQVKGIAYIDREEVVVNPPRPFVPDLDSLIPAWDLVDWEDYTFFVLPESRLGLVNSSRGCINGCSFCSQKNFWRQSYRERSAESFVDELIYLNKVHGVNVVMLSDEYPTRDRRRWERILDLMIEKDVGVNLLLETCVSDILRDADIMEKYRRAGVLHIYVGVEATSQDKLDLFNKNISCEHSREAIRLINEAGMISECSFVLGLPDETKETIAETLKLAKHYNPDFAHFLMIAPWPYADAYRELKDYIEEWDYSRYNFIHPVVRPRAMTMTEINRAIIDCYKSYYMEKLEDYTKIKDDFKRKYMLRSMQVMLENSFLTKYMSGLGEMPAEVRKILSREINF